MSISPLLSGMPEPESDDSGATVTQVKELPNGVLITMSDGREIRVHPGDDIDIRPITRDTQIVTEGNPEPRNFRDLHNEGKLPDIIAAMLAARPQNLPPVEAPTPPTLGAGAGAGPGGPMLPDMAGALGGPPAPPGGGAGGGMMMPAPGTPPPVGLGPLGMPPGTPQSDSMPPGLQMPPMPPDVPTLPGMPPPQRR